MVAAPRMPGIATSRRPLMTMWRILPLLLALSLALPALGVAQSPSFSGEWRTPYKWVVVIEQNGSKVRGSWKESYKDKSVECSGIWFDGALADDKITGTVYPCGGQKARPLDLKIVNQDTLEMSALSRGGGAITTRLTRVK
jgi:hypothetical protein